MSLNISTPQDETPSPEQPAAPSPERLQLIEALVAELTAWSPREFMASFRRLHKDAISLVHLNVLTLLDTMGPMSMGKLAEALDVSVASLTGIITRMETRGLVERVHSEDDRRVVLVRQTDAGADILRGIDEHRRVALGHLATYLTEPELAGLLLGHRALRAARLTVTKEASGLVSVHLHHATPTSEEDQASS